MKNFDISTCTSEQLDHLEIGLGHAIIYAKENNNREMHEDLIAFRKQAQAAKRVAIDREAVKSVDQFIKDTLNKNL